jgi:hypothetical protein
MKHSLKTISIMLALCEDAESAFFLPAGIDSTVGKILTLAWLSNVAESVGHDEIVPTMP